MMVNLHPDIETIGHALVDFVKEFNWRSVVILYSGNQGQFEEWRVNVEE